MTKPEQSNDADRAWESLIAAARTAQSDALPPLDAEQIARMGLGARSARPQPPMRRDEHLVSWTAVFAVAASLLLTVACWSDVVAAWSPEPAVFELPLSMEPWE